MMEIIVRSEVVLRAGPRGHSTAHPVVVCQNLQESDAYG